MSSFSSFLEQQGISSERLFWVPNQRFWWQMHWRRGKVPE
jgi:hypothetical protein